MTDRAVTVRGNTVPLDSRTATNKAIRWGVVPAMASNLAGPFDSMGGLIPLSRAQLSVTNLNRGGGYPKAREIPWPYDDEGVAFPGSGYVQIISGHAISQSSVSGTPGSGTTLTLPSRRHWLHVTLILSGIPAATTGTVELKRPGLWRTLGAAPGDTTIDTFNIDGANGLCQELQLAELVSAPDDYLSGAGITATFNLGVTFTWAGTAPLLAVVLYNPPSICSGPIVPATLHADFTARTETDWQRTRDVLSGYPGWSRPWQQVPVESPYNWHFTRASTTALADSSGDTSTLPHGGNVDVLSVGARQTLGMPAWTNSITLVAASAEFGYRGVPSAWINGELKRLTYFPTSQGVSLTGAATIAISAGLGIGVASVTSSWVSVSSGAGWRNLRFRPRQVALVGGSVVVFTAEVRINGVSQGTIDLSGTTYAATEAGIADWPNVFPPTRDVNALLEFRITLEVSGAAGFGNFQIRCAASPRIDIPIPSHCAGEGGIEAPGGYLASAAADPAALGGVLHNGAGVSSVAWSIAAGVSRQQSRLISFLPPTTGLWKITSPTGLGVAIGPYEFAGAQTYNAATAILGSAGKRFFGLLRASLGTVNGTWTLAAGTRTGKAIATGGTVIVAADLSPATIGYLFGEIALPAAGTYRIWASVVIGTGATDSHRHTLEMLASLTDPYVLDDVADSAHREPECWTQTRPSLTSLSTPPGSPSVVAGVGYFITATATGAWLGREGQVAYWTNHQGWWFFTPPEDGTMYATVDGTASYWTGTAWAATAGAQVLEVQVTVEAAQTVYLRVNRWDPLATSPQDLSPLFRSPTLTIGWDLV